MAAYTTTTVPAGERIRPGSAGRLDVPDRPIIPYIEGDGTGPDIWRASQVVFDAAVKKAYGGKKQIAWMEVYAGEKAFNTFKEWLPNETVEAIRDFRVAIKGGNSFLDSEAEFPLHIGSKQTKRIKNDDLRGHDEPSRKEAAFSCRASEDSNHASPIPC